MQVTGNRILDALDFLKERTKTLDSQFQASLYAFESDTPNRDPREIMDEFAKVGDQIARLQELQAAYNLRVEVEVEGVKMTLQRVLQLIATSNRSKALWMKAAAPQADNPYAYMTNQRQRDKDNEYAKPVVPPEEAQSMADAAIRHSLAFKQALRSANAREVEMDTDPELFKV